MEDCYKQKKSLANTASASDERGLGNGIWSFKYFLTILRRSLEAKMNMQERLYLEMKSHLMEEYLMSPTEKPCTSDG